HVDYDAISMLNVSATQALSKRLTIVRDSVQYLNHALKDSVQSLHQALKDSVQYLNRALKDSVNYLNAKMATLELVNIKNHATDSLRMNEQQRAIAELKNLLMEMKKGKQNVLSSKKVK
ncbi:MAG: hypothetical protein QM528_06285, partial [Phycisphaerales bacterium]|nr:hypothetical protein [Phycisphaerales bacterium]